MRHNSSDQLTLGSIKTCLEYYSDATSVHWWPWNRQHLILRSHLDHFIQFLLVVVIVYLQDLSTAEKYVALVLGFMEFFIKVGSADRLLDLWDGLACQDGLVYHTCSAYQHDIARNVSV